MKNFTESDMYEPIKKFFTEMGYDVKGEVKSCDIAMIKDDELFIIEMKKNFNAKLLFQAIDRQNATPQVFIAIPRGKRRDKDYTKIKKIASALELGLITVAMDSAVRSIEIVCFPPALNSSKAKYKKRKDQIIKESNGRTGDLNKGGSVKKKIASAYREKAIAVACALKAAGESKPSVLVKLYNCDKNTLSIVRSNFYGWFERVSLGIYTLSELGFEMLENSDFSDLVEHYSKIMNEAKIREENHD